MKAAASSIKHAISPYIKLKYLNDLETFIPQISSKELSKKGIIVIMSY